MAKLEVFNWRVDKSLKQALEDVARREQTSLDHVIERAVRHYLADRGKATSAAADAEQARLGAELESILAEVDASNPGGPPTPSLTNARSRAEFAGDLRQPKERRKRRAG